MQTPVICKTKVKKSGYAFMSIMHSNVVEKMHILENEEILVQFKPEMLDGFGIMKDVKDYNGKTLTIDSYARM
jgi:hypothetical protein